MANGGGANETLMHAGCKVSSQLDQVLVLQSRRRVKSLDIPASYVNSGTE
jgi:hypothetical protein